MSDLEPHLPGPEGQDADSDDEQPRQTAEAIRQILTAIHGTHIAPGQASPATVQSRIDVEKVAGYVAAVRARSARGTSIGIHVRAGEVEQHGKVVGLDVDSLG
jgi:hypothetical protein